MIYSSILTKEQKQNIFKLSLLFAVFIFLFLIVQPVHGATEFISIIDPDDGVGTDFTSLSAWEATVQSDLTSATTSVFSYATTTDNLASGVSVTGETSGATATLVHRTASSTVQLSDGTYGSSQILLADIDGVFITGQLDEVKIWTYELTKEMMLEINNDARIKFGK